MTDKYDEAIEHLTLHPSQIPSAWIDPSHHFAGCLFTFVGSACLTMIRNRPDKWTGVPWHDEIVADERIPSNSSAITVEDLPVFAEWQRKING